MTPFDPDDQSLAAFAESVLPAVALQLREAVWTGLSLSEPARAQVRRFRLEHAGRLVVQATGRTFSVAANLFEAAGQETALHHHRYPLAVVALSIDDDLDAPLYEMTWVDERRGRATELVTVVPGATWAIAQPSRVRHTVRSLRPHASIVIADVTKPPSRTQRLDTTPMKAQEITRVRTILCSALARAIANRLPPQWHRDQTLDRPHGRPDTSTVTD